MENQIRGDETDKIETIGKIREIIVDLFRGYPQYVYFGKFEFFFGKKEGQRIVNILTRDKLLETDYNIEEDTYFYRLTPRGIDFAVSLINLEHSESNKKVAEEMLRYTGVLVILAIGQFLLVMWQIIFLMS